MLEHILKMRTQDYTVSKATIVSWDPLISHKLLPTSSNVLSHSSKHESECKHN